MDPSRPSWQLPMSTALKSKGGACSCREGAPPSAGTTAFSLSWTNSTKLEGTSPRWPSSSSPARQSRSLRGVLMLDLAVLRTTRPPPASTPVLTLVEAIVIHVSVDVEVLPGHQGELCFRVLIGSIIGVVAADTPISQPASLRTAAAARGRDSPVPGRAEAHLASVARSGARWRASVILHLSACWISCREA